MKLKNKEKKLFLKLTSVIIGIILWAIIIYTEDANFDAVIKSIPIQISGETVIADNGLIVANRSELGAATVSVRGKRSDIINSMINTTATVDVSGIDEPGKYNLKVSYELASNAIYITQRKLSSIEIVVERAEEKEFDVEIIQQGTNPSSGIIVESRPETERVKVKGTGADLAAIKHMAVYVDISEMLGDTSLKYQLVALDEQYRELKTDNMIYPELYSVGVSSKLHKRRTLPVKIEFPEEDREKYAFEILSTSAEEIEVGADTGASTAALRAVLDYDEAKPGDEYILTIEEANGIYIPNESKTVTVRIKAYPMAEQYVTVPLSVNALSGEGYSAPSEISLRVKGAKQYLAAENITASADITGYGAGVHNVEVEISFSKQAMYLPEKQYVNITIQ